MFVNNTTWPTPACLTLHIHTPISTVVSVPPFHWIPPPGHHPCHPSQKQPPPSMHTACKPGFLKSNNVPSPQHNLQDTHHNLGTSNISRVWGGGFNSLALHKLLHTHNTCYIKWHPIKYLCLRSMLHLHETLCLSTTPHGPHQHV